MKPGTVVDRYVVEAVAGEGGMGVVYRVRHQTLGTFHALKVLGRTPEVLRRRFEREARLQARLRHPNVVRVTDVLDLDGQPALIAEFVDGPTLSELIRQGPLPVDAAVQIFRQVTCGVQAAHALGIVHRDLKPDNILLCLEGAGLRARVSDFGIASVLGGTGDGEGKALTRSGVGMGTPAYMAPEQSEDAARVDHRADMFSLGCVLYEMLGGRRPFSATGPMQVARDIAAGAYPPLHLLRPDLPRALVELVQDCLQPDPEQRLPSCEVMLDRLDHLGLDGPEDATTGLVTGLPAEEISASTGSWLDGGPAPSLVPSDTPPLPAAEPGPVDTAWPRPRPAPRSLVVGLFLSAALLLILAIGQLAPQAPPAVAAQGSPAEKPPAEPSGTSAPTPAEQPAAAPAPEPAATPAVEATPAPVTQELPTQAATARPAPAVEAQAPATGSAREEAPAGFQTHVRFEGGATRARLVSEAGSFPAGPVPPGRYTIRARFGDGDEVDAGYVSIREGEAALIRCYDEFQQCRRSP